MLKDGYIFDGDEIFAEKADSLVKYSAEVMKNCITRHCHYYSYCTKVGFGILCFELSFMHVINDTEESGETKVLESSAVETYGYIFNEDVTFDQKANALLQYSVQVMKECTSRECRYYTYCTQVGYDIVCLSILFRKNKEFIDEEEELQTSEELEFYKKGYIFNDDEIFAEKGESLLKYSAEVMKTCTTEYCRYYTFCNQVGYDIVCLSVWLKSDDEFINDQELNILPDFDYGPNDVPGTYNEDIFNGQLEDYNELSEGKDRNDEYKTESEENKVEEEEEQI
ncbi:uncharacterized protein LOC142663678 [Rhinoderma darwinii]|uniref:uncharacterized protein LOC142663678 n=1 Tax=Rhinoderma darwinii TaxID=43563 RepID=UPI003F6726C7